MRTASGGSFSIDASGARRLTGGLAVALLLLAGRAGLAQAPPAREIHHVHGLAIAPTEPDVLFVATHTGLVRLRAAVPPEWVGAPLDLMGFTAHPRTPELVYASGHPDLETYRRDKVGLLGLLVSRDGGRTWGAVGAKGQADFHVLTYGPRDGGQMYGWNVADPPGLFRVSLRTSAVVRVPAAGLADVLGLSASADGATLLAGTRRGLLASRDGGTTWAPVPGFAAGTPVTAVKHHLTEAPLVYAYVGAARPGLLRSRDGGTTWADTGLTVQAEAPVVALAVGPGEHLAVATAKGSVLRSADGGRTWLAVVERGRPVPRVR